MFAVNAFAVNAFAVNGFAVNGFAVNGFAVNGFAVESAAQVILGNGQLDDGPGSGQRVVSQETSPTLGVPHADFPPTLGQSATWRSAGVFGHVRILWRLAAERHPPRHPSTVAKTL
jgi:hypothetical protein